MIIEQLRLSAAGNELCSAPKLSIHIFIRRGGVLHENHNLQDVRQTMETVVESMLHLVKIQYFQLSTSTSLLALPKC
jgi:hypothetical protein